MSGRDQLPSGLVTFMFTDIEGSTRLARMLGSRYRQVLGAHRDVVRRALIARGGVELFTEGDSFFAAFGDAASAYDAKAGGGAERLPDGVSAQQHVRLIHDVQRDLRPGTDQDRLDRLGQRVGGGQARGLAMG